MADELKVTRETLYTLAFVATVKQIDVDDPAFVEKMCDNVGKIAHTLQVAHEKYSKGMTVTWEPSAKIVD